MRHKTSSPASLLALAGVTALVLSSAGCVRLPKKAIADAERARTGAEFAAKCAPEQYAAAQRMMDRMRELVAAKRYGEAETAARTAEELYAAANKAAEARRAQCLRELQGGADGDGLRKPAFDPLGGSSTGDDGYELTTVFFGFNEATISPESRAALKAHAAWLQRHTEVRLQIAGHCDERGSTEYNLALGERRAEAVRKYLGTLGVDTERLATISYGEELPLAADAGEGSYRRNRRAEFRRR